MNAAIANESWSVFKLMFLAFAMVEPAVADEMYELMPDDLRGHIGVYRTNPYANKKGKS